MALNDGCPDGEREGIEDELGTPDGREVGSTLGFSDGELDAKLVGSNEG